VAAAIRQWGRLLKRSGNQTECSELKRLGDLAEEQTMGVHRKTTYQTTLNINTTGTKISLKCGGWHFYVSVLYEVV
jgi:hypothetical protein